MQRDGKSKENHRGKKCKVTATGFLVMTTSLPRAVLLCLLWTQLGNQVGGGSPGARGCSSPKYTSSGKGNYRPGETVRRQPPPPPPNHVRCREMYDTGRIRTAGTVVSSPDGE